MLYFDPIYFLFIAPAVALSIIASLLLKLWTNKYSEVPNIRGVTGFDTVQKVVQKYNLEIKLEQTRTTLGDSYNPREKLLSLSPEVAQRPTIAAVAITAHELGHAIQDQRRGILLRIRTLIVPIVNIGTTLGYFLILIGLIIAFTQMAWFGVILFSFSTLFSFLTLPIEIDASTKALNIIREFGLLNESEISGAKKVLVAASLTYIAAAVSSLLNLSYFVFRIRGASKRH